MKAHLMYRNADFHLNAKLCYGKDTLIADLELTNIIATMSKDDMTIQDVCVAALFQPLQTIQEIKYRQDILLDCMNNPETVRKLYDVTVETIKRKQSSWSWVSKSQCCGVNLTIIILRRSVPF